MDNFKVNLLLRINRLFTRKPSTHPLDLEEKGEGSYPQWEYKIAQKTFRYFPKNYDFKRIIEGKTVLDNCCGAGGKAVYLSQLGAKKVIGVDIGEEFIVQARDFAKKTNTDNCEFLVGDAHSLPFPDDTFDLVFSFDAFEHVSNPKRMLDEAFRVLKPGGKMFMSFTTWYKNGGHHLTDAIKIPWVHVFVSEQTLMKAYKKLVTEKRYIFRAGSSDSFKISYINKMTVAWSKKLIKESKFVVENLTYIPYPHVLKLLHKIGFKELFTRVAITILEAKK